jgi:ribosome-binding protein aMBF1 (putative translation factor)
MAVDDQPHLRRLETGGRLLVADLPARADDDPECASPDPLEVESAVVELPLRDVEPLAAKVGNRLWLGIGATTRKREKREEGEEKVDSHSSTAIIASMRYRDKPLSVEAIERLRQRLARAENGWFFAQVAHQVAAQRQARGFSQQELAHICGTTQSAIARLEKGGRPPRIDTLLKIAEALDCDLAVELRPRESRPIDERG